MMKNKKTTMAMLILGVGFAAAGSIKQLPAQPSLTEETTALPLTSPTGATKTADLTKREAIKVAATTGTSGQLHSKSKYIITTYLYRSSKKGSESTQQRIIKRIRQHRALSKDGTLTNKEATPRS